MVINRIESRWWGIQRQVTPLETGNIDHVAKIPDPLGGGGLDINVYIEVTSPDSVDQIEDLCGNLVRHPYSHEEVKECLKLGGDDLNLLRMFPWERRVAYKWTPANK